MRCRMARTLVRDGGEEQWSAAVGAELRAHLARCADCARLQRESALTTQWLRELPVREPAPHFEWRLKLRLSQQAQELPLLVADPAAPRRWLLPFALSTAAAAALVLVVGLALGGRVRDSSDATRTRVAEETPPGPWAARPAGRSTVAWPRLVPVRASTPLGPEVRVEAAASILGGVPADTLPEAKRRRSEPVETMPVRW